MAHILVVEKSQSRRYFIIRTLENAGHAVAAADGADGAVALMAHGRYDLLLTNGDTEAAQAVEGGPTPAIRVVPQPVELGDVVSKVESALAA